jgi:hypothetical protein
MAALAGRFDMAAVLLSTGRTGTMAIARYLRESYPGVCALHEPRPSRHLRRPPTATWPTGWTGGVLFPPMSMPARASSPA